MKSRKKWVFFLLLWIIWLPVRGVIMGFRSRAKYESWKSGPRKEGLKTAGYFVPGGYIVFKLSPLSSLEGYYEGEVTIKPVLSEKQKEGIWMSPSKQKVSKPGDWRWADSIEKFESKDVKVEVRYDIPENPLLIGEKFLFEIKGELTIPVQVGTKYFDKVEKSFSNEVEIAIEKITEGKKVPQYEGNISGFLGLLWFIGIILFIKYKPKRENI